MDFNKTALPLFIDLHTTLSVEAEQVFDIILSPSLYWVKHVSIPVKSLSEVKKVLPSLFENTVPKGKYSYYAYEDKGTYIVFAYDDRKILATLLQKGITSEQINRVYFAQSEFHDIKEAISIDEECILDVEDHVVVKLPKEFVSTSKPLELSEHDFSEHSVTLAK